MSLHLQSPDYLQYCCQKRDDSHDDGGSLLPPIDGEEGPLDDRTSQNSLISECGLLFPRKFDQSRWQLRFDVDLALRSVDHFFIGYGGRNGQLIASEGSVNVPVEGWSEAFYKSVSGLWTQLEMQLDH